MDRSRRAIKFKFKIEDDYVLIEPYISAIFGITVRKRRNILFRC